MFFKIDLIREVPRNPDAPVTRTYGLPFIALAIIEITGFVIVKDFLKIQFVFCCKFPKVLHLIVMLV